MELSRSDIMRIQRALTAKGFDTGPIDTLMGPRTESAIVAFKESVGLRARPFVVPITRGSTVKERFAQEKIKGESNWLRNARSYMGLREFRGRSHNPKIHKWWKLINASFEDDDPPALRCSPLRAAR